MSSPAATTGSVTVTSSPAPLTTVFTPPSGCLQNLESVQQAVVGPITYYDFHLGYLNSTECMPPGWSPSTYLSPGRCPSGYTMAISSTGVWNLTTETRGTCCPSDYNYVRSGGGVFTTQPCSSHIDYTSLNQGSSASPTKSDSGLVIGFAVSVRWKSEDFSTTAPQAGGGHKSISTGAKAGIGIGVTAGVLICIIIGLTIFFSHRKKSRASATGYTSVRVSNNEEKGESGEQKETSSKKDDSPRWSILGFDSWLYECIAVCLSIACFVAIICLLQVYNGRLSPQLPHGLRLNTIVSILATASKSALLFVVGECISQLRWVSFRQSPKLLGLAQTYDSASRGPWGSLIVLFKDKGRSFVTIGALVMVLALAFDPFVQQIISYPLQATHRQSSSAVVSQSRYLLPDSRDSTDIEDAMNAGVWIDSFPISVSCPTGNCTWPQHRSIEMCTKCADVTSDAKLSGWNVSAFDYSLKKSQTIDGTISLSHGRKMDIPIEIPYGQYMPTSFIMSVPNKMVWIVNEEGMTIYGTTKDNYEGYNSTLGIKDPLLVVAYAQIDLPETWSTNHSVSDPLSGIKISKVTKCALSLCSKKYEISVREGITSVNVSDVDFGSFYTVANILTGSNLCWKPTASPISNWTEAGYDLGPGKLGYYLYTMTDSPNFEFCGIDPEFYSNTFPLNGYSSWAYLYEVVGGSSPTKQAWLHDGMKDYLKSTFEIKRVNDFGLEKIMSHIALSISQLARSMSDSPVFGTATTMESYVHVVWPWLTLPAVLLLTTIVLLFATAVTTSRRRINLWKSSILPFLFHGLENNLITGSTTAGRDSQCESVSEMDQVANKLTVDLGLSNNAGRTMLRGTPQRASTVVYRESRRGSF